MLYSDNMKESKKESEKEQTEKNIFAPSDIVLFTNLIILRYVFI